MPSDRERPPYNPGDVVGSKYRLVKVLGEGGMSVVYDSVDTTCARKVAVKVIRPRYAVLRGFSRERMQREAEVLVKLHEQTEFVVDVLTSGITEDEHQLPFYVMERLRGDTLRQFMADQIKRDLDFTMDEIAGVAIPMAVALAHAHALGVVHRDTKPENAFMAVTQEGRVVVKVLDFGICAQADDEHVASGFSGTLPYAAPEQLDGRPPIPATDIYALGLVLFELATLKLPHGRHRSDLTIERLALAVMKNPNLDLSTLRLDTPPRFAQLVSRCLALDPLARPSAHEVAKTLRDIRLSYLGEMSGATQSQSAATDVTGMPIELLQEQLAAASKADAPREVHVVAGSRSIDLAAATDAAGVDAAMASNDDVVFFRRSAEADVLEAPVPAPFALPSALAPKERAPDQGFITPSPVITLYQPSEESEERASRVRGWTLEDHDAVQEESDRLAASQFVKSAFARDEINDPSASRRGATPPALEPYGALEASDRAVEIAEVQSPPPRRWLRARITRVILYLAAAVVAGDAIIALRTWRGSHASAAAPAVANVATTSPPPTVPEQAAAPADTAQAASAVAPIPPALAAANAVPSTPPEGAFVPSSERLPPTAAPRRQAAPRDATPAGTARAALPPAPHEATKKTSVVSDGSEFRTSYDDSNAASPRPAVTPKPKGSPPASSSAPPAAPDEFKPLH